ncbi:hypothetical protein JSP12_002069 [Staphylococcus pseudintermedius]|nr:hypothetical protein [Staphylococcus pseudintermedius]EHD0821419.1 hypothetical protein [Staphylococcus pseudintermedius]EHT3473976.1 hypothetical protein [Staphylococcus pseudintermedius]EIQ4447381.1 hypothetical protein [Staphylococcus pseudintermedius]EKO8586116.1 hypothetical protein [Staphylococcus pseudintermedius]
MSELNLKKGYLYYKNLIKEAFNIENRQALCLKKKEIASGFVTCIIIVFIFTLITNYLNVNLKELMKQTFEFFIDFFSITIGFTITALVFLADSFSKFKKNVLHTLSERVKRKICQQLSSTLILSISINLFVIMIGFINNNILINISLINNEECIKVLNFIGYFFVYTLFYISLYLIFKTLKYLKKYIDYIIE